MKTINFEQYLSQMRYSDQTIKSYLYSTSVFLRDKSDAISLKYRDIIAYLGEKEATYNDSKIKVRLLPAIKKYYDYLIEIGKREDHPCRTLYIKTSRNKGVIVTDFFNSAELELLLTRHERYKDLKLRNQALSSLMIYQGLSAGEIASLKPKHIDLDKGTLYVKASRNISSRHLEIPSKQYRILDQYMSITRKKLLRGKTKTDALLIGKLGTALTIDDINYLVSTFKGLFPDRNLNPKTIRQSVISNWLNEKKLSLEQVQLMAGHKWISSTLKYRQNDTEEQREMMNKWFPI